MAKLSELKIQQLKKELEQRGLLTTGNKTKLQARLHEAMEEEDVDIDEYVFQLEGEESLTKAENPGPSPGVDLNVIIAALSSNLTRKSSEQMVRGLRMVELVRVSLGRPLKDRYQWAVILQSFKRRSIS